MAVLSVDLLWHTSEIIHKADRQRPRPNWTNLPLKKNKFTNKYHDNFSTDHNPSDETWIYSLNRLKM